MREGLPVAPHLTCEPAVAGIVGARSVATCRNVAKAEPRKARFLRNKVEQKATLNKIQNWSELKKKLLKISE